MQSPLRLVFWGYGSRGRATVNQLNVKENKLEDSLNVEKILHYLSPSFDHHIYIYIYIYMTFEVKESQGNILTLYQCSNYFGQVHHEWI